MKMTSDFSVSSESRWGLGKILAILVPLFVLLVPVDTIFRHLSFRTSAWDLGIYHQSLSQLSRFKELNPFLWIYQFKTFNDHFDPIKLLVAPLFALWDSAMLMILLDALAALAGLIPVVMWMEKRLSEKSPNHRASLVRFAVVFGYLFSDFLWNALLFPSHPTQWAMAFLAWIFYYYEKRIFSWGFWINLGLFFACKEEFPFLGLTLGAALWTQQERRTGVIVALASTAAILLTFFLRPVLMGDIAPHGSFLGNMLGNPAEYFSEWIRIVSRRGVWLPILLIITILPLKAWRRSFDLVLIMSAPFVIRLLSLYTTAFGYQYMAIFVPFLAFAFIRNFDVNEPRPNYIRIIAWRFIVVTILGLGLREAPFHHPFSTAISYFRDRAEIAQRRGVVKALANPDLKLSAPNNWTPQLTDHEFVAMPSVWIEIGKESAVDVWVWDLKGDYFPSKLTTEELQAKVKSGLGSNFTYETRQIGENLQLWVRPKAF